MGGSDYYRHHYHLKKVMTFITMQGADLYHNNERIVRIYHQVQDIHNFLDKPE